MSNFAHALSAESNRPRNKAANKSAVDFFWRDLFHDLFPINTAASVAYFTRTTVRAAEHVLNGRNGLGGRALAHLLRSPFGPSVLDAIAGDVEWRAKERRLLNLTILEQELKNLELKKRELAEALVASRR